VVADHSHWQPQVLIHFDDQWMSAASNQLHRYCQCRQNEVLLDQEEAKGAKLRMSQSLSRRVVVEQMEV